MKRLPRLALLLLVLACGSREQAGPKHEIEKRYARGPVQVAVRLSHAEITIAERLELVLEVVSPRSFDVELPKFGDKLEQFGIVGYSTPPPQLIEGGRVKTSRAYVLEPFLSGDYRVPPMTVRFQEKGKPGAETHEASTEAVSVRVKSLLPDDVKSLQIRDIAGPVALPFRLEPWAVWCLAATAVPCVVATVWWFYRRRAAAAALRCVPPHEIAYRELEDLVSQGLIEKGAVKAFYNGVSAILRHYIENRFGLKAPERTTEEFLVDMEASEALETAWKVILGRFLSHCDLVKFAEHQPSADDIRRTFDTCQEFIEATRERPGPTAGASPAPGGGAP